MGGELPHVPKSSAAFVSVKVSALVDHPDLKPILEKLKTTPEALDGMLEMFGVMPHEIDRVTLFWPTLSGDRWIGDPVLVVSTRDAYNEARLLKSLNAEPVFNDGPGGRGGAAVTETTGSNPAGQGHSGPTGNCKSADSPPLSARTASEAAQEDDACSATAAAVSNGTAGDPLFYELSAGRSACCSWSTTALSSSFRKTSVAASRISLLGRSCRRNYRAARGSDRGRRDTLRGRHSPSTDLPCLRARNAARTGSIRALFAARNGTVTGDLAKSAKLTLTLFDDAAAATARWEEGLKTLAAKATRDRGDEGQQPAAGEAARRSSNRSRPG